MPSIAFDVSHYLSGSLVLLSFVMLYQDRMFPLIAAFAIQALLLALSIAWQAFIQNAPHLLVTAGIALIFKAAIIPVFLRTIVRRLNIHREIESVGAIGTSMLIGMGVVALSMALMLRATSESSAFTREDLG